MVLVLGVVILAGSWFGFSGREGLSPTDASEEARAISDLYLIIGVFAVLIFLSVALPLALIIARYRERGLPREVEGPQVRGNARLELAWTVASIVIVIVIVSATLWKASALNDPAEAAASEDAVPVLVEGRQFYFRYVYENSTTRSTACACPSTASPTSRSPRPSTTSSTASGCPSSAARWTRSRARSTTCT